MTASKGICTSRKTSSSMKYMYKQKIGKISFILVSRHIDKNDKVKNVRIKTLKSQIYANSVWNDHIFAYLSIKLLLCVGSIHKFFGLYVKKFGRWLLSLNTCSTVNIPNNHIAKHTLHFKPFIWPKCIIYTCTYIVQRTGSNLTFFCSRRCHTK